MAIPAEVLEDLLREADDLSMHDLFVKLLQDSPDLGDQEFREWVELESFGYPTKQMGDGHHTEAPKYRWIYGEAYTSPAVFHHDELPLLAGVTELEELEAEHGELAVKLPGLVKFVVEDKSIARVLTAIRQEAVRRLKRLQLRFAKAGGATKSAAEPNGDGKRVAVVHGRNAGLRKAVFDSLTALGLQPLEWEQCVNEAGKGSPYVGEVLDALFRKVQAVVVLFSGDDLGQLRKELWDEHEEAAEKDLHPRARQNVLLECGMALAKYPDRTIMISAGACMIPSDLVGRHVLRMSSSEDSKKALVGRLKTAGCAVDAIDGWKNVADFPVDVGK